MHVALAADRRRVAKMLRRHPDRLRDVVFLFRLRLSLPKRTQRISRLDRPGPRAKILGGELLAAELLEVLIHIRRLDHSPLALAVHILKQLVPRQLLAAPDDFRHAPILYVHLLILAALAPEAEADARSGDLGMLIVQRRQPIRFVLARVLLVANAQRGLIQQAHHRRQHLLAWQIRQRQIGRDPRADGRQRLRERDHAVVFRGVAHRTPVWVVAILLAPLRVLARRLQVPARVRADPHLRPRRRNAQRPNTLQRRAIPHRLPPRIHVAEAAPRPLPPDARLVPADVPQAGGRRGLNGINLNGTPCPSPWAARHSDGPRHVCIPSSTQPISGRESPRSLRGAAPRPPERITCATYTC